MLASSSATFDTRLHPLEALAAIRRLFAAPDDTRQVFVVLRAMRGGTGLRLFRRFAATRTGQAILAERRSLLATLQNRSALAALPQGTFGWAYDRFMAAENLSAAGLVDAAGDEFGIAPTPEMALFRARLRDAHDLGHVLTGYGRDGLGELCLLAFNFAQTRHLGMGMIALMGVLRLRGFPRAAQARRAVLQAFRLGRRAAPLAQLDWEALLAHPLDALRARLRIGTPTLYQGLAA